jgi:hypothetical protein
LPCLAIARTANDSSAEPIPESMTKAQTVTRDIARHGLTSLSWILDHDHSPSSVDPRILISLIGYTNEQDPWTTSSFITLSQSTLRRFKTQAESSDFIIKDIFTDYIRPLFLKTKKLESITTSGRKAMPSSAPSARFNAANELDHKNMPWRYDLVYTVTVLGWAIENIAVCITPSPSHESVCASA